MDPLQRLKEAAQAFRGTSQAESSWFDKSQPDCREGERLLKEGDAASAERIFRKAAGAAKGSWGQKKQRPRILLALATAEWRQGKLSEASSSGGEALVLLGGIKGRSSWEYGEVCELLARVLWDAGDRAAALERMKEAVAGGLAQRETSGERLVGRQRAVGELLRESGREAEAEEAWKEALETAESRCGVESAAVAACLMDLCGAAVRRGGLEEARRLGERAVQARRRACGNDSMEVAKDLESLAGYFQAEKDFETAVRYLEQALQVRDRQIGGSTPELAMLLMALADVYSLLGRIAPALELMRQAVGKLGPGKDRNLSVALEKLGAMYRKTGRYEDAADCYARARQYWGENAEEHANELMANSQALEELSDLLPASDEPAEEVDEGDDPGISVLLPKGPVHTQPAAVAGGAPPAAATATGLAEADSMPHKGGTAATPGISAAHGMASDAQAGEPAGIAAAKSPDGAEGPLWVEPSSDVLAPGGSRNTAAKAESAGAQPVEPDGWNGWEDVEFELLLADREGLNR